MEFEAGQLAVITFLVAVCGKLIWNIWTEARREAREKAELSVENKVKIAVVEERVDGHEKRIGHLEEDEERSKQAKK